MLLISGLLSAAACANGSDAPEADDFASEVGVTVAPVVGGKPSTACAWPSTVDIGGCTGTLIHPRVVTTAAHCLVGTRTAKINFTDGDKTPGSFSVNGTCRTGASFFGGGGNRDWGYCVLPDDPRIKQLPITPPLVGCEAERFLKPGATAWVVGFGTTGSGLNDNGIKREVEVKINKVGNGLIDIGDKEVGACHGDSGGPLYMKLTDGMHDWGYRVLGSTSGAGGNCDCACSTVYVDIAQHVKAIEANEDIDVTPCTDADGNWDPGPDCMEFQSDPQHATGSYPMCSVAVTHDPIASCGEPAAMTSGSAGSAGSAGAAGATAAAGGASGVTGSLGTAGAAAMAAGASGGGTAGMVGAAGTLATVGAAAAGATGLTQPALAAAGAMSSTPFSTTARGAAAGRGAAVSRAAAGTLGTRTDSALAAGAASFAEPEAASEPAKHGCQVTRVAASGQLRGAWVLALLSLVRIYRRRVRSSTPRGSASPTAAG